jgi:hypothetical protein
LPIVAAVAPDTPSTVGFGVFVLIVTVAVPVGGVPVDQLPPIVQSLLVVPVHTCAPAGADQLLTARMALAAAINGWHRLLPLPLPLRRPVNSEATTHVPRDFDQMMRNMRFIVPRKMS